MGLISESREENVMLHSVPAVSISSAKSPGSMLLVSSRPLALPGFTIEQVDPAGFDPMQCIGKRVVFVDAHAADVAEQVLRRIRQHPVPAVYLLPLILLEREVDAMPRLVGAMADGVCTPAALALRYPQHFAERVAAIHTRLAQLAHADQAQDTNLAFKFLRYLFVRSGRIAPVHDTDNHWGYHYPELDAFLSGADENVFAMLDFLEGQRLLAGEFVDRIHLCGSCHSAFLNFRETCPHCHSADLNVDDLIHHFRCAHVAPLDDFRRGGHLVCPKCEHELKQVGVDYDKPSAVYVCQSCGHTTQEPETDTLCYRCGAGALPEHLDHLTVKAYSLTGLAENAAQYGLDNLFRGILESELDILPLTVFKRFLAVEVERVKRYHVSHSSLCILLIEDLDRIYIHAGPRAKDIFGEFGRIVRAALRTSDVISAFNESLFLILATETPIQAADDMGVRLKERLDELIRNNFDQATNIVFHALEIEGGVSGDALIDRLVNPDHDADR
jgi:GGDEF domain-containing protein